MTFTPYFYLQAAFIVAFQSRDWGVACGALLLFHDCLFFAVGNVSISDYYYVVLYNLIIFMFSIIGWMWAWMLNVPSGWTVIPFEVLAIMRPKKGSTNQDARSEHRNMWYVNVYRIGMSTLLTAGFAAAPLFWEYFPQIDTTNSALPWAGWALTAVGTLAATAAFYLIWKPNVRRGKTAKPWKLYACPYRCGDPHAVHFNDKDMTIDATIYILIYFAIVWFCFGLISLLFPTWVGTGYNSFYLTLMIWGLTFAFALLARFTWLYIPAAKKQPQHMVEETAKLVEVTKPQ